MRRLGNLRRRASDCRSARRRRLLWMHHRDVRRLRHAKRGTCLACVVCLCLMLVGGVPPSSAVGAVAVDGSSPCSAGWVWPVERANIKSGYDPPSKPWLSGHRGIDLAATAGTAVMSPADGVIRFSGVVGGKTVVSVDHGTLISSFEPAFTDLPVGAKVARGERFARVEGSSDHCDGICLHWGVKRGNKAAGSPVSYVDPKSRIGNRRIGLKPTAREGAS